MLPRMPGIKSAMFIKRLVVFHQTFAPLGGSKNAAIGIIWHEGISGRNGDDVASAFVKFINSGVARDKKHITIWCDNCGAQNKNWTLYTCLTFIVNTKAGPDTITLKYLEKGHTFMSADSFHSRIEAGMKKDKNIYDFQDFSKVVNQSGQALIMNHTDFAAWPNGMSSAKSTRKPTLKDVVEVRFIKGKTGLSWKLSFDDDYSEGEFLMQKISRCVKRGKLPDSRKQDRGILPSKKADIIKKSVN